MKIEKSKKHITNSKKIVPLDEARDIFFKSIKNAMKIFEISLLKNRLASSRKEAKEILQDDTMSDQEVEMTIGGLQLLTELIFDHWTNERANERKNKNENKQTSSKK